MKRLPFVSENTALAAEWNHEKKKFPLKVLHKAQMLLFGGNVKKGMNGRQK